VRRAVARIGRAATTLVLTAAAGAAWSVPAYADTSVAEAAGGCTPTSATPTATIATRTVRLGGTLRLTGTGWCHPTDGGSRIGVKIDEGAISRLDASLHANRTIWAIVEADDADGTFTADIRLPDGTSGTSSPALATGTHTLRLLSGSLVAGDAARTLQTDSFEVVGPDETTPEAPAWAHEEVRSNGAVAWVQREVSSRGTLRISGVGWTRTAGGPSTIAVKLNLTADGQQARRSGSGVIQGDPTIWALIDGSTVSAQGSFDTTLDLPPGLSAGQHLTVSLFSGKFASGDTQRTATTRPLVVDGVAWQGEDAGSGVTCRPTSATPTVKVENPSATFGGILTVSGAGWCNPSGGGSRIGVKIDEGAISRLDSSLHANRTIWAVVQAEHTDGTFTADIRLPDGTTKTSSPALARGSHTLRLLSGSLVAGDTVRTVESAPFVVGRYRPNGIPEPVSPRPGNREGVTVAQAGERLQVRVRGAGEGDWVFLSAYTREGSPRYPWGDRWFRTDARGGLRVTLPTDGTLTGRHRLVVQDGAMGRTGRVLGWDDVAFPGTEERDDEPRSAPSVRPTPSAPAPTPAQEAKLADPPAPVPPGKLTRRTQRAVSGSLDGATLALEVPAAEQGHVGFVTAYVGRTVVPVGGAVFDKRRRVLVDLGDLVDRPLRLAVQDATGRLLGWYRHEPSADVPSAGAPVAAPADAVVAPARSTTPGREDRPPLGTLDAVLSGAGVAVLLAAWGVVALRRRGAAA